MEPVGYIPTTPAFRKELKKRDEFPVEVVVGELKLGKTKLSGAQSQRKDHFSLRELEQFISRQVQHSLNVFSRKKLKGSGSIHGITFVVKLSVMKESPIA